MCSVSQFLRLEHSIASMFLRFLRLGISQFVRLTVSFLRVLEAVLHVANAVIPMSTISRPAHLVHFQMTAACSYMRFHSVPNCENLSLTNYETKLKNCETLQQM